MSKIKQFYEDLSAQIADAIEADEGCDLALLVDRITDEHPLEQIVFDMFVDDGAVEVLQLLADILIEMNFECPHIAQMYRELSLYLF